MKAFGILILLVVVGFSGYQFAYQPIADYMGLKPDPVAVVEDIKPEVIEKPVEPAPVMPEVVKVEPPPAPPPMAPAPEPPPAPPMPAPPVVSAPMPDADGFIPPTFPTIEEAVKGWAEIPKGAFIPPRAIKAMKPLQFMRVINGNKIGSNMAAGSTVYATGQDGAMLTVATSPEPNAASAQIGIDDTDLKAVLSEAYERWKVGMVERARRQHLFAKESAGRAQEAKSAGPAKGGAPAAGAPKKNADGTYDVLLASMKAGQVTEITPTNIKKWGDAQQEKIDGKDYWTIVVDYTTKTMFGDFDTQAQARIAEGKVEKWIYTGSGEVVP